jgi:PAS domain S-box-containing protein
MSEFRVDDLNPRGGDELLESFFADAAVGLSITDLQGRFVKVNPAYCALTGYTEAELHARDFQSITHPDDLPRMLAKVQSLLSGEISSFLIEKRYIRKDAIIVWVLNSVSVLRDKHGQPLNLVKSSQDISERMGLEESLRQAQAHTESILSSITDTHLLFDRHWHFLYVNDAAVRAIGCPREQIIGQILWDLYPDLVETEMGRQYRRAMDERVTVTFEFHYERPNTWWDTRFYPVPAGLAVFATDITERKLAAQASVEAERKYRDIFENAGEGIFQTTPEGQYIVANPALARMHGFDSPEEFIRCRQDITREVYVDPARREEFKRLIAEHGVVREFEHQIYRKDGSRIWISVNARAVRNEQGTIDYYEGTALDITERKVAEANLRQSESQLAEAQHQAHLGSWTRDLATNEVILSDELFRLFGMEPRQAGTTHETFLARVHPEDRTRVLAAIQEAIRTRQSCNFEFRVAHPDGVEHVLHERIQVTVDEQTEGVRLFGITQDITERKRSEEELRESEERFSKAFHSSPAPLIVTRLVDGCFLNANDSFLSTFGYERDEVIGKTVRDLNIYVDRQDRKKLIDELREQGSLRGYESRARTKSGRILDLLVFVEPIKLKGEQCILSTAYDITERKSIEHALRESEERYRELFENAKDALYVHDLGGRYTSFNRAAEQLSGFSREEILGKHFSNFVAPGSLRYVRENLCKKLDDEGETTYEIDLITKDRRRVPVEVSSRLIYENGKPVGVQGVARDMTERKRAQEALRTYSQRLIEAQEAERQVIARELHDEIGQVLTAVRINLQSLQHSMQNDSQSSIDDSLVIVDEALDRVRELSLNLRPSVLDNLGLSSALRWYVDRCAQRSGIVADLQSDLEDGRRLGVELETACFRIVQEALTNVVRHARATRVLVRLKRSNGNLSIKVTDNGVGFDLAGLIKNSPPAWNLGLRGMEERAVAAQGRLKIDSAPMRGTEISVSFPLKEEG